MASDAAPGGRRYRAFVTYSHRDKRWAARLHRSLEAYRVPRRLVGRKTATGEVPRRLAPIFRDREELATADELGERITDALERSDALIVVCSPASARSRWVNEEVLRFKRSGRGNRILCLIVGGEPFASEDFLRASEECFAPALRNRLAPGGELGSERAEPLAADVRPGGDGWRAARLKLIAGLLGLDLDELRRRELQRRNRRLAAVTAGSVLIMAVTSLLAVEAVIQRNVAERRQRQAEGLVSFMLGSLSDKLRPLGRLDILASLDEKAMKYFESLPASDVNTNVQIERARALEEIGNTRYSQGDFANALEAFRAELKLTTALAKKLPHDAKRQEAWGQNYLWLGYARYYQGDMAKSERAFRHATSALEGAAVIAPGDTGILGNLAEAYGDLGNVAKQRNETERAHADFLRYLTLAGRVVAAEPGNSGWQDELGNAYNDLGLLAVQRGDFVEAVRDYQEDQQISAMLVAKNASDNQEREYLVLVDGALGRTLYLCGQWQLGIHYVREAVSLANQLVAFDPTQTSWRADRGNYSSLLARMLFELGDPATADTFAKSALADFATLIRKDSSNQQWQSHLAQARLVAARIAHADHDDRRARSLADAAVKAIEPALKTGNAEADDPNTVAAALLLLADVHSADQGGTFAGDLRQKALRVIGQALKHSQSPQNLAVDVAARLAVRDLDGARPTIERLWRMGYRTPAFVTLVEALGIPYPVNATFTAKIKQFANPGEPAEGAAAPLTGTAPSTSPSQATNGGPL